MPAPDRRFLIALYSRETQSRPPSGPIHAFAITENWPEITSWKTQPDYDPEPAATCQFEPGTGWKLFDVTAVVCNQAKAGKKGHGVLLRFLSEDFSERGADSSSYKFVSREATGQWATRHPVLLVVEASKPLLPRSVPAEPARTAPPAAEETGPAAAEDLTSRHSPANSLDPELIKLAPGPIVRSTVVSKDCMVLSYIPGWNFGQVDNIGIGNNDGGVRTLIGWPEIPANEASSLERWFLIAVYSRQTISHPPAGPIRAFEILEDWPEITSWTTQPRYSSKPAATYEFRPERAGSSSTSLSWSDTRPRPVTNATARSSGLGARTFQRDREGPSPITRWSAAKAMASGRTVVPCSWSSRLARLTRPRLNDEAGWAGQGTGCHDCLAAPIVPGKRFVRARRRARRRDPCGQEDVEARSRFPSRSESRTSI